MLKINRLKIVITTAQKKFGFDENFNEGINIISSYENTKGKSSIIESIYYCLGIEELIGGKNDKTLKSVFRNKIEFDNKEYIPLDCKFYLEIENVKGKRITINRNTSKVSVQDSKLITVFDGNVDESISGKAKAEEYYTNLPGAATNNRGFHVFLEKFLEWKLPEIPTYDGVDRKLYMQVVFASMFIEQKRGWADILIGIPNVFKIIEPKKRVVEFILGLDSIDVERKKADIKKKEEEINLKWKSLYENIWKEMKEYNCISSDIFLKPRILSDEYIENLNIQIKENEKNIEIDDKINSLNDEILKLKQTKPKVGMINDTIQNEFEENKEKVEALELMLIKENEKENTEKHGLDKLNKILENINLDINNNKDAKKLMELGSIKKTSIGKNICPLCQSKIEDSLLLNQKEYNSMSIEENIEHLNQQKKLIEYAINNRKVNISIYNDNKTKIKSEIIKLRRIIRSQINDLYEKDDSLSETSIYIKVDLQNQMEHLELLKEKYYNYKRKFIELSEELKTILEEKEKLPKDKFTERDKEKIARFEECFKEKIKKYGYKSENTSNIQISLEKLIPTIDGFDMRFDNSGSDNIRAIWAYTISLLIVSKEMSGNHPNILIIDEPMQQSVIEEDLFSFIDDLNNISTGIQVIIGMTLGNQKIRDKVKTYKNANIILLEDKAIQPME